MRPRDLSRQTEGARRAAMPMPLTWCFHSGSVDQSRGRRDLRPRAWGWAIVRAQTELGGRVSIERTPCSGTSLRMILPLTLATFRGGSRGRRPHLRGSDGERGARALRHIRRTSEPWKTVRSISCAGAAVWLVRLDALLELPPGSSGTAVASRAAAHHRPPFRRAADCVRGGSGPARGGGPGQAVAQAAGARAQRHRRYRSGHREDGAGLERARLDVNRCWQPMGAAKVGRRLRPLRPSPRQAAGAKSPRCRRLHHFQDAPEGDPRSAPAIIVRTAVDGMDVFTTLVRGSIRSGCVRRRNAAHEWIRPGQGGSRRRQATG